MRSYVDCSREYNAVLNPFFFLALHKPFLLSWPCAMGTPLNCVLYKCFVTIQFLGLKLKFK